MQTKRDANPNTYVAANYEHTDAIRSAPRDLSSGVELVCEVINHPPCYRRSLVEKLVVQSFCAQISMKRSSLPPKQSSLSY